MKNFLHKFLAAGVFAMAAGAMCAAPAIAAEAKKPVKAKTSKAKKAKEVHPKATSVLNEPDEAEPDITDTVTTDFECELGNKVTVYKNEKDEEHIALRWKKRLHRLTRVGTTTGAQRYENIRYGLIWIGIPSKGMLLDSKLNRQLANECKNSEQSKHAEQPKPAAELVPQATQPAV